ncbi:hypothetical protein [Myroides sp. WP-1]|uniref:hypothetical protein n=1 Tax=Myroides sp. WP-1 TaxID=2759944 RepID=UPI0015FCBA51|nr:hypothetical protein [Myroides sp. WP-1]MBB1140682.1 hypothetical protein [Myroides sp. WP-1]
MKIRDLFVLLIKLIATLMTIELVLTTIPSFLVYLGKDYTVISDNYLPLLSVAINFILFILLFAYAEKIVKVLKIEKGFSSPILPTTSLTISMIAQLGVFFIGLSLLIGHLPTFLSNSWYWFKAQAVENPYEYVQTGNYWFVSVFNLVIGYMLISNSRKIAFWFVKNSEVKEKI